MCVPTPSAPPPPPPREEPKEMTKKEIYDSTPHFASKKKSTKKSGKAMLKTDLNVGSSGGSGINIA